MIRLVSNKEKNVSTSISTKKVVGIVLKEDLEILTVLRILPVKKYLQFHFKSGTNSIITRR